MTFPDYEFHISRIARDKYQFDQRIYALNGNAIIADFRAARQFADQMNKLRGGGEVEIAKASEINAIGLMDEILHTVVAAYRQDVKESVFAEAISWLKQHVGLAELQQTMQFFCQEFPPVAVYQGQLGVTEYLQGERAGRSNLEISLEELIMLWLTNGNPAISKYAELFEDKSLSQNSAYQAVIAALQEFFETQPPFGPEDLTLLTLLRQPALRHPDSIFAQLEYLTTHWSFVLEQYLLRIYGGLDFFREEHKPAFFGPGPVQVPVFNGADGADNGMLDYERYSTDSDWMPRLVLLAKNSYVWLNQLSKKYQREIKQLDQIPDEELAEISRRGFNGLWLIGLWERSNASQRIKHLCGNSDAVASAYSLYDYTIAHNLGGDPAYESLRNRAAAHGVRLAADMVPNHTGIYSKWVIEHPDWFLTLDDPPFPSYTFNGTDLSEHPDVGIYLDDHYYARTDAAVVFKRVDRANGRTQYIYHGNDGTSMPWNDTAQINYLNPEAREAVIQTILSVARKFSVIRFDAAMTLAKKHVQRLWFPEPGSGGAIPSRAEHALTRQDFDQQIPEEFWIEVVDRVAQEVPDTLLLAEAFWMMEGYFVRTLGMHRVYNSAFMHMLRDEDNDKYRQLIKNTLEYDPQILKRYVNFMSNPDEETAIEQFGDDGKYFGVAVLMSTLPGLPMYGHGQVEGYYEKYGMEYQRAYYEERPNARMVERHHRELAPILQKRYLFAEVDNFLLYDFGQADGSIDENVYAFSNRHAGERALVVYHNCWADTRGWIKTSAAYLDKNVDALSQQNLAEGLQLPNDAAQFVIFRDHIRGLQYIRNCADLHENGLYIELGAFQYQVFWDFSLVQENEQGHFADLNSFLQGGGTPDIGRAQEELVLQSVLTPYRELINAGMLKWVAENQSDSEIVIQSREKLTALLTAAQNFTASKSDLAPLIDETLGALQASFDLPQLKETFPLADSPKYKKAFKQLRKLLGESQETRAWGLLLTWVFTDAIGQAIEAQTSRTLFEEWLYDRVAQQAFLELDGDEQSAWSQVQLLKCLLSLSDQKFDLGKPKKRRALQTAESWLKNTDVRDFLGVNWANEVLWYTHERLEELAQWVFALHCLEALQTEGADVPEQIMAAYTVLQKMLKASKAADYQVEQWFGLLGAKPA